MNKSGILFENTFIPWNNLEKFEKLYQESKESDWHFGIWKFILDWHNEKDFIQVKTSGSTGTPKVIELKKDFVTASAKRSIEYFNLQENQWALLCLSSEYIASKLMIVRAILGKLNLHIIPASNEFVHQLNREYEFTAMVPLQMNKQWDKIQTHFPIKKLILGGSGLSPILEKKITQLTTEIWHTYGMTETATHIAIRNISKHEKNYKCLNGIQVKCNEESCLQIEIPEFSFQIQTNDIVECINSTEFKYIGRIDNVINSGGFKIHIEDVEQKLLSQINNNLIIASIPDPHLGQKCILIIEGECSVNKLDFSQLHPFEKPQEVFFIDQFSYSQNGKIDRQKSLLKTIEKHKLSE